MSSRVQLLLIAGSLRRASTNEAALHTIQAIVGDAMATVSYDGLGALPYFSPDDDRDPLPAEVVRLRAAIAAADGLMFSTPEYAGALPGSFKNLLDWTIGGGEIYHKPVGWVNVSAAPTGAADAYRSLRTVLTYASCCIVESACRDIPVTRADVGPAGLIDDDGIRRALRQVANDLADAVQCDSRRRAEPEGRPT